MYRTVWTQSEGTRVPNVEFPRQSGVRLEFKDETFDRAVGMEFLEHRHPDDVLHLAEVRRVLCGVKGPARG